MTRSPGNQLQQDTEQSGFSWAIISNRVETLLFLEFLGFQGSKHSWTHTFFQRILIDIKLVTFSVLPAPRMGLLGK